MPGTNPSCSVRRFCTPLGRHPALVHPQLELQVLLTCAIGRMIFDGALRWSGDATSKICSYRHEDDADYALRGELRLQGAE
jgi:hypothetical protein